MKRYVLPSVFVLVCVGLFTDIAYAGMPNYHITEIARLRLSAISFFLFIYFLASFALFGLWHFLRKDFSALPRLSFKKALALVFLWGLAFQLVLVMIAGTRELMTPEAWERAGIVHKLAPDRIQQLLDTRRYKLEQLRTELWRFADEHNGQFPPDQLTSAISEEVWLAPAGKFKYLYVGGLTSQSPILPLAYEPDKYGQERMVLLTNGMIELLSIDTIQAMTEKSL